MRTEFTVPGRPQGKARARTYHTAYGIRTVTPERTVLYENLVKASYQVKYKKRLFQDPDAPLSVTITAVFEPPASCSIKRKRQMIDGELFPTKKPDSDNICKCIMDAMNGTVYPDDKQVVSVVVRKVYGSTACVHVTVEDIVE